MVMHLWGENAASPMNLLHFGFGAGNMIAPLIARPFLSPDNDDVTYITTTVAPLNTTKVLQPAGVLSHFWDDSVIMEKLSTIGSQIEIAYGIVGIMVLAISVLQLAVVIKGAPKGFPHWVPPQTSLRTLASPGSCARGYTFYGIELLTCLFLFFASESGASRSYFEFIFSIATEGDLNMSKSDAALLQTAFWICYTLSRGLISPLITAFVPVQPYLAIVCISSAVVTLVMAFFGPNAIVLMWICNCLFGIQIAVPFPNAMAWANLYLDMNSMATMILLMGNSFGGMAFQAWAGSLYDNRGPDTVFYITALGCIFLTILFIILQSIAHFQSGMFKEAYVYDDNDEIIAQVHEIGVAENKL